MGHTDKVIAFDKNMKMPITVNFELTYSCNAKCKFYSTKNNVQSNFVDITKFRHPPALAMGIKALIILLKIINFYCIR